MSDTAQPIVAAETSSGDPVADAAAAFRALREPEQPQAARDDRGRFAAPDQEHVEDIAAEAEDYDPEPQAEIDADPIEADEAADEAQPDAVDMPASWSKEDAELWEALPPDAQAKLVAREGQREAAVNSKFQEVANARKAAEAQLTEANANRDAYAQAIDQVVGLLQLPKPDPTQYGMGTGQYDRDAYEIAVYQWENAQGQLQALHQQRQTIAAQQEQEAQQAQQAAQAEIEQVAWPKFLETVPELADPEKGRGIIADIVKFAVAEGLPEDVFRNGQVNSHEMRLLWEAKEYRRIKAAGERVKAGNPPPKPATPPVRPGTPAPASGRKQAQFQKDMGRLAKTGSIEDGAAIFRHLRQGN